MQDVSTDVSCNGQPDVLSGTNESGSETAEYTAR